MTYTTEQLIDFLEKEHEACVAGERVFPLPDDAEEKAIEFGGFMGAFLGPERLAQVGVYHDYRDQIHEYQRNHQVSGVIVATETMPNGSVIRFPRQADQLILVDGDMEVLRGAKNRVVAAFVGQVQKGFYYLSQTICSKEGGEWSMETTLDFVGHFASDMEWATVHCSEGGGCFGPELSLQVGYGEPGMACYTDNKDADCWFFDAKDQCRWNGPPEVATPVSLSIGEIVKMRQKREEG